MQYSAGFDDEQEFPSDDQIPTWDPRRSAAPDNEAPAGLDFGAVLGRTDETAVSVSGFQVYSTGLAFTLSVRLRRELPHDRAHRFYELISGHGPAGSETSVDERLLLGVEYADGRTATNVTSSIWTDHGETESVDALLTSKGGGGGGRVHEYDFWLFPLPPAGPLTFICRWASFGIAETHTELDGTPIVAALARVQTLWPWEPEEPLPEPPDPQLPTDGWFGQALRKQRDRSS